MFGGAPFNTNDVRRHRPLKAASNIAASNIHHQSGKMPD